jgi:hypothetical protein
MSKVVRSVKNVTKGYSSVQVKVRNGKTALNFELPDSESRFARNHTPRSQDQTLSIYLRWTSQLTIES